MSIIRAFIAITVPPSVQKTVEKVQGKFKQIKLPIRWVKSSHLHMTLKFLGNIKEGQIGDVEKCLTSAGKGLAPFILKPTEIGVFPNLNYPRVLWLGFSEPTGRLHQLEENIEHHLQKIGFQPEDRKFTPHLTFGRIKLLKGKTNLIRLLHEEKNVSCDDVHVKCFKLMKSDLQPSGPEYSVLQTFDLGETE